MISIGQVRAARGLLGWSQTDLAAAAGLSVPTIKRAEGGNRIKTSADSLGKIQAALESAGIVFIAENGGGAGVRLAAPEQGADACR